MANPAMHWGGQLVRGCNATNDFYLGKTLHFIIFKQKITWLVVVAFSLTFMH
jgi:hypothetical protein